MEINTIAEGFKQYYKKLTEDGYVSKMEVFRLIIAKWIYDFTNFKYCVDISREEYEKVNDIMYCISGSCLVPYETFCHDNNVNVHRDLDSRITEDVNGNDFRIMENEHNRRF